MPTVMQRSKRTGSSTYFPFKGKPPKILRQYQFSYTFFCALGEEKSPLQVERFNDFMEKINLCEFIQRVKTGLSSFVNDYQSLNTQV